MGALVKSKNPRFALLTAIERGHGVAIDGSRDSRPRTTRVS